MRNFFKTALFSGLIACSNFVMADVHIVWQSGEPGTETRAVQYWNKGTTTSIAQNSHPVLSGSKVLLGKDSSVKLWQAGVTQEIATNAYNSTDIAIDGNNIVYRTTANELNLFNGTSTKQLYKSADELIYPGSPQMSGNTVVWQLGGRTVPRFDIPYMIYDGSTAKDLNTLTNTSPSFQFYDFGVSGKNVVWGHHIYPSGLSYLDFWNGTSHQTIKSTVYSYTNPKISGNNVAFVGTSGSASEIFVWNGTSVKQITSTSYPQTEPQISGNNVVWLGNDGNDTEVYFWNGTSIKQLTNNDTNEAFPRISGNQVVWVGTDGNDDEIYWWNGTTNAVTQITNNTTTDGFAQISVTEDTPVGVADGTYLIKNVQSGKHLNRAGASTQNGTLVQVWECSTCTENKWVVKKLATGQYSITAVNATTAALDIAGAFTYDGANVQLWSFWSGANQKFNLSSATSNSFYIAPSHVTNKVIGITANQLFNGALVTQQTKNNGANQQWVFVPVQ
jgi:Ricin-type beta-trefoil lectin domain-like